jgi:hypothetical protein
MFVGRLVERYGIGVPLAGGCLQISGLLLMAGLLAAGGSHLTAAGLAPPLALVGLGNGLLFPPLIGGALSRVRPEQAGSASGSLNTSQQFANSLGVALIGTLFLAVAGHDLAAATTAMAVVNAVYAAVTVTMLTLVKMAGRAGGPRAAQPGRTE